MVLKINLILVLLIPVACFAQQNRLSVNLRTLDAYGVQEKDTSSPFATSTFGNKGTRISPTVSYYRVSPKGLGYGITIGYYISRQNLYSSFEIDNRFSEARDINKSSAIFIQPSITEQFDLKNYLLIFSLNLPVQYTFKTFSDYYEGYLLNNVTISKLNNKYTFPKQLDIGLNLGGGVHRRIGKSFMIGAEVNVGVLSFYRFDKRTLVSTYTENDVTTENVTVTNVNEYRYRLTMNPMLSISYCF